MNNLILLNEHFLKYHAFKMCKNNKEEAEDLYQETMLKVVKYFSSYDSAKGKFTTFATKVMLNTYIDKNRKEKNKTYGNKNKIDIEYLKGEGFEEVTIENIIGLESNQGDYIQDVEFITKKVNELKGMNSKMMQMWIEGFSYEEIANELETNVGSIKSRIFRSRAILREQLNEFEV